VHGLVLDDHRPTLADLARPRLERAPRWVRWALALLAVAWHVVTPADQGARYVRRAPIAFNFRLEPSMHGVAPRAPELVRLERRRGGLYLESFAVEPLALPPFRGDVSGLLPVYAEREIAVLRRRFAPFELMREGKARVNQVPGYEVQFQARLGRRRLFGRVVLLPEPAPGEDLANPSGVLENARARRGVRLVLLSTPAGGSVHAFDVGAHGDLKTTFRSFRFGTEGP